MPVVVVESPAKAKTIEKYLGKGHTVLASYGHVRDLPAKNGSVDPDADFAMVWEADAKGAKRLKDIADAVKTTDKLILATDPDREGEAISWHLVEALRKRRALKKATPVERVVFNAITKAAVTQAMKQPRALDQPLVDAYLARRALDYLVGFTLSPVLWRKLPGAKSAGRVQSVSLRLVVEREMEIERFVSQEYWTVKTAFTGQSDAPFEARLTVLDGKKLEKFDLPDQAAAETAVAAISARDFAVKSVEAKPAARNPPPPFMTSTLQQEASRKLGFGAQATMRAAQKLYEAGHITYMRTDGVDMAPEAVKAARSMIASKFGDAYVPSKPRVYKTKAKNAQEAHECVRPTNFAKMPGSLSLERDQERLYELIWKRTMACQMASAQLERTTAEIESPDAKVGLRATGQVIKFDGFLTLYQEGKDDDDSDDSRRLPALTAGEALKRGAVTPDQHFTQPPPRFTDATLVKRMEELGIGRPSTYASILTVLQDREYVRKDGNRFFPEDKGRLVIAFLESYFQRYVEYDFTANLEEELDDVSGGRADWKAILRAFWTQFKHDVDETKELRVSDVLDRINEALADHVFTPKEDGSDPRLCPTCGKGQLNIKASRHGAFIGCDQYPECNYTRPFGAEEGGEGESALGADGKLLGHDDAGTAVTLRSGRFGLYVQLGEAEKGSKVKPKRASPPKDLGLNEETMTLEWALKLLALPREIGPHPEDGRMVAANFGRFGPYIIHGDVGGDPKPTYANIKDPTEVFEIGLNRAVTLLAEKKANPGRGRAAAKPPLKDLGEHPDGGAMAVLDGRYGPYVKWGKVNATLPKDVKPEDVTVEIAVAVLAEKVGKTAKKKPAKSAASKKKSTAKSADAGPDMVEEDLA